MAARLPLTGGTERNAVHDEQGFVIAEDGVLAAQDEFGMPVRGSPNRRPGTRASRSCSSDCPGERRISSAVSTVRPAASTGIATACTGAMSASRE